jgi:hypothetical protein
MRLVLVDMLFLRLSLLLVLVVVDVDVDAALECGYWLAPSSIPGTGLGMFSGKDFAKDETFDVEAADLVIPFSDIHFHPKLVQEDFEFAVHVLWGQYTWGCSHLVRNDEGKMTHVEDQNCVSPGMK